MEEMEVVGGDGRDVYRWKGGRWWYHRSTDVYDRWCPSTGAMEDMEDANDCKRQRSDGNDENPEAGCVQKPVCETIHTTTGLTPFAWVETNKQYIEKQRRQCLGSEDFAKFAYEAVNAPDNIVDPNDRCQFAWSLGMLSEDTPWVNQNGQNIANVLIDKYRSLNVNPKMRIKVLWTVTMLAGWRMMMKLLADTEADEDERMRLFWQIVRCVGFDGEEHPVGLFGHGTGLGGSAWRSNTGGRCKRSEHLKRKLLKLLEHNLKLLRV